MHRVVPKVGFRKGISLQGEGTAKKTNWSKLVHGKDFLRGEQWGLPKVGLLKGCC